MMNLTLFVIPGDDPRKADLDKAIRSFGHCFKVRVLRDRRIDLVCGEVETEWFAYLYDNEYLEVELKEALPIFLLDTTLDYMIIWKKARSGGMPSQVSRAPRIFRAGTVLQEGKLVPDGRVIDFSHETILNGWILENE